MYYAPLTLRRRLALAHIWANSCRLRLYLGYNSPASQLRYYLGKFSQHWWSTRPTRGRI